MSRSRTIQLWPAASRLYRLCRSSSPDSLTDPVAIATDAVRGFAVAKPGFVARPAHEISRRR